MHFKAAGVTPIFKKEAPKIPSNYRSISVLSVFSKFYDKCISAVEFLFEISFLFTVKE